MQTQGRGIACTPKILQNIIFGLLKHLGYILPLLLMLSGCVGGIWTGASLIYDRHNVYKKVDDYHLLLEVTNALYSDKKLKAEGCVLDLTVFNHDVLVAGHLPSDELLNEARQRLSLVKGYRHLFNEITVSNASSNTVQDGWITAKIRSQMFADDSIDPKVFKVITTDRIVYLMGDVQQDQGERVVQIARRTVGVLRVVKILQYFTYQTTSTPNKSGLINIRPTTPQSNPGSG